ncbi:MAG: tRNA preQ1(34) S-adenosylmethionine ribosyltransferase-isomerase QueA [Acidobacteriota bacterium]
MRTDDFDFDLPDSAIAQHPVHRGQSRLLWLDETGDRRHRSVADLPELLDPDDLLVVNDTKVIPARLFGRRAGGGKTEILLLERHHDTEWTALARPAKRLREGSRLTFGDPAVAQAEIVAKLDAGQVTLRFDAAIDPLLTELGEMPLPPYIDRPPSADDADRYQTVYARRAGAVAAPTAGLHFSTELLEALDRRGIARTAITLHVGPGTFRPVKADQVHDHRMDAERWWISPETADAIARCRARGGRMVAVGTTVVRTLETAAREDGVIRSGHGATELFITPGFDWRAVDVLMTNFHLPRSTLLMLVAAFAGQERVLAAYREAVEAGYRFYSYGDAMLTSRYHPPTEG